MKLILILLSCLGITTYNYAQANKFLNYVKGILLFEEFRNPDSTTVYSLYFAPSKRNDLDSILSSSDTLTWYLIGFPGDEEGSVSWFKRHMEKSNTFKSNEAVVQDISFEGIPYEGSVFFLSIPGELTYTSENCFKMSRRLKKVTYKHKRIPITIDRYIYWNSFYP